MRRKRGNSNIKILQSQIQNLALSNAEEDKKVPISKDCRINEQIKGAGVPPSTPLPLLVPVVDKIKKKGIKKDELINTKRLLTM